MGHSYNTGTVSSNRGMTVETIDVLFGAAGAASLVDRGKAGFVSSIAKTDTGRYTFQLSAPYPAFKGPFLPVLDCISATGAIQHARYVHGSYSATAGTFEIDVTDNGASPAAVDPTSGTTLNLVMYFQRYTNI